MISSICRSRSRGTTTAERDREIGLSPLHRLEVFVLLHQLSSQFTIYLPWTVLTFSSYHLWQIPDTLGQASLETSYSIIHTTVSVKGSLHMAWHTGLALLLYSHINLSSIRQVGGSSGRCSPTLDRSSSQPLALFLCRKRKSCGSHEKKVRFFWIVKTLAARIQVCSATCQKCSHTNSLEGSYYQKSNMQLKKSEQMWRKRWMLEMKLQ